MYYKFSAPMEPLRSHMNFFKHTSMCEFMFNKIHVHFILFLLLNYSFSSFAQSCGCHVTEVEQNKVKPCGDVIGPIDTVQTTAQLRAAIIRVNAEGGNRTILIEDGTYPIASPDWYPYITASNIVIRSLSGNRNGVIITGTGMKSVAPLVEIGFYIIGDNVTIADMTIRNLGNHGIAVKGDNLFVHNVRIQNTFEQMLKGNRTPNGIQRAIVECSLFEYTAGVGPQFYIGGLDIHGGNYWNVYDNVFKNIASPSKSQAEHAIHFWDHSADNFIHRNIIINCDRGIGFGLGKSPNEGGIISNNMIYNDGKSKFNDVGIGLESSPNTKVFNNTLLIEYPNAIEYRFEATQHVQIINNLTNQTIRPRNGGKATLITNFEKASANWFVDPSAGNLRLNGPIAQVVDRGTYVKEVLLDIDRSQRPLSFRYDIGAHEYLSPSFSSDESSPASHLQVFPTPATHSFTLISTDKKHYDIQIYDALTHVVLSNSHVQLNEGLKINTASLPRGVYFCRISTENNTTTIKRILLE